MSRIDKQLEFFFTSDLLKTITRQNRIHDESRDENVAEHSWHLALMVLLFAEYAPNDVDLTRVTQLLVVHDLIEIYAGDTHAFHNTSTDVERREWAAGKKLFGLLPDDQELHFWNLWREFEEQATSEAKFARALDVLHPSLMTWGEGGGGSKLQGVSAKIIIERKRPYLEAYPELWRMLEETLARAVKHGIMSAE